MESYPGVRTWTHKSVDASGWADWLQSYRDVENAVSLRAGFARIIGATATHLLEWRQNGHRLRESRRGIPRDPRRRGEEKARDRRAEERTR